MRRVIYAMLAVAVAAVVVLALWWLPQTLVSDGLPPDHVSAISDARSAVIQALAGLALAVGLFYTAQTFRLNREGHVTDRFIKAVDQLGSSSSDVRVGGVYSLERLMSDSGKDHETIVEVLSAFIRRNSPASGQRKVHEDWTRGTIPDGLEPLATEVQAALTVLARRPDRAELRPIDLRRCDLRLAFLHGAKFRRAILNDSWLDYADLGEIDLREASLRQTGLAHTWMRAARLDGANVRDADFRWAYLREASLENTAMEKAKVDYADLDRPTFAR